MQQRITIEVDVTGKTEVEAHGIQGSGCEAVTEAIEAALGGVRKREFKPEYRARATHQQEERASQS